MAQPDRLELLRSSVAVLALHLHYYGYVTAIVTTT